MSVYDDMAPEDILRIEQETKGPKLDMQARFRAIDAYIEKLRIAMKTCPQLRLGQMIVNTLRVDPEHLHMKLFYVEDGELTDEVNRYACCTGWKSEDSR